MLKKWMLGIILLSSSMISQAGIITSNLTGADMAGIEVTATFDDSTTQTLVWAATGADSGAAGNAFWSLSQSGNTFGEFPPGGVVGEWSLTTSELLKKNIVGLSINGAVADIFFDIFFTGGTDPNTAGSLSGREFVAFQYDIAGGFIPVAATGAYANQHADMIGDLWGTLNIAIDGSVGLSGGEALYFVTDTDRVEVSEPASLSILGLAMIGLFANRRRLLGK